jgi:hypothetical protein
MKGSTWSTKPFASDKKTIFVREITITAIGEKIARRKLILAWGIASRREKVNS